MATLHRHVEPFLPAGFGKFVTSAFTCRAEIMAPCRSAFANRHDHVFWIEGTDRIGRPGCLIVEANARSSVGETGQVNGNGYACIFAALDGKLAPLKGHVKPLAS